MSTTVINMSKAFDDKISTVACLSTDGYLLVLNVSVSHMRYLYECDFYSMICPLDVEDISIFKAFVTAMILRVIRSNFSSYTLSLC